MTLAAGQDEALLALDATVEAPAPPQEFACPVQVCRERDFFPPDAVLWQSSPQHQHPRSLVLSQPPSADATGSWSSW